MSEKVVLGTMAVAVTNNAIADMRKTGDKLPSGRLVLGGFIVTIGLLLLSEAEPKIAEAFGWLVVVASLVGPAGPALPDAITKATTNGRLTLTPTIQTTQYNPPPPKVFSA